MPEEERDISTTKNKNGEEERETDKTSERWWRNVKWRASISISIYTVISLENYRRDLDILLLPALNDFTLLGLLIETATL